MRPTPEHDVQHPLGRRIGLEAEEVAFDFESGIKLPVKLGTLDLDRAELP